MCSVSIFSRTLILAACYSAGALAQQTTVSSPELIQPPICSSRTAVPAELIGICEISTEIDPEGKLRNKIKLNLTAATIPVNIGGYRVLTENYNGSYVTPVVEALPGEAVAAHLVNMLVPRATDDPHSKHDNPTNLHYFHGGVVTPRNSRALQPDASLGTGDNVYVRLKNGLDESGNPMSHDYFVPIPGEGELDAGVLERKGVIAHPDGLGWYHSHMHGISSDQVMAGQSGLLSVGDNKAAVRAKCEGGKSAEQCLKDDKELKAKTIVRYAMLRDVSLAELSALPEEDAPGKSAVWVPTARHQFDPRCYLKRKVDSAIIEDPGERRGYCQYDENDPKKARLYTLNGQRFPTVTVHRDQNLLLRLGNLSANIAYWLELYDPKTRATKPLTILGVDGIVPAGPLEPSDSGKQVDALSFANLLLMPASRVEIYIRNDFAHLDEQTLVLRTKELDTGEDQWPEVQLAQVVLKPTEIASPIDVALNVPVTHTVQSSRAQNVPQRIEKKPPPGCIPDLEPGQHRRIMFFDDSTPDSGEKWSIGSEIARHPGPDPNKVLPESAFEVAPGSQIAKTPFETYVNPDHSIDWLKLHLCVRRGSGKELWVLTNTTGTLHNFHIHQMKFRLARRSELESSFRITPPKDSQICPAEAPRGSPCTTPNFKLFEENKPDWQTEWHDVIPVPAGREVYVVMSFVAREQVGRFVFHCHILMHEDKGLMAPIEVWDPADKQSQ